jgi:hypothetical protein
LQQIDGTLSFGTDAWMSPNHKAYVAVTVHFEQHGQSISLLLDLVDLACSHTGANLAKAFVGILDDFEITDKVRTMRNDNDNDNLPYNQLDS